MERNGRSDLVRSLGGGLAGATAVTLIHEAARRAVPDAPRMDILGMRALAKPMRMMGWAPPRRRELHTWALVGDILSNSLYYSFVGGGRKGHTWMRGALLGTAAGIGSIVLPSILGLESKKRRHKADTMTMRFVWYLAGGLTAAAASRLLARGTTADTGSRSDRGAGDGPRA